MSQHQSWTFIVAQQFGVVEEVARLVLYLAPRVGFDKRAVPVSRETMPPENVLLVARFWAKRRLRFLAFRAALSVSALLAPGDTLLQRLHEVEDVRAIRPRLIPYRLSVALDVDKLGESLFVMVLL